MATSSLPSGAEETAVTTRVQPLAPSGRRIRTTGCCGRPFFVEVAVRTPRKIARYSWPSLTVGVTAWIVTFVGTVALGGTGFGGTGRGAGTAVGGFVAVGATGTGVAAAAPGTLTLVPAPPAAAAGLSAAGADGVVLSACAETRPQAAPPTSTVEATESTAATGRRAA